MPEDDKQLDAVFSALDSGERPPYLLIEGSPAGLAEVTCTLYHYGYRPLAALAAVSGDSECPVHALQSLVYQPECDDNKQTLALATLTGVSLRATNELLQISSAARAQRSSFRAALLTAITDGADRADQWSPHESVVPTVNLLNALDRILPDEGAALSRLSEVASRVIAWGRAQK